MTIIVFVLLSTLTIFSCRQSNPNQHGGPSYCVRDKDCFSGICINNSCGKLGHFDCVQDDDCIEGYCMDHNKKCRRHDGYCVRNKDCRDICVRNVKCRKAEVGLLCGQNWKCPDDLCYNTNRCSERLASDYVDASPSNDDMPNINFETRDNANYNDDKRCCLYHADICDDNTNGLSLYSDLPSASEFGNYEWNIYYVNGTYKPEEKPFKYPCYDWGTGGQVCCNLLYGMNVRECYNEHQWIYEWIYPNKTYFNRDMACESDNGSGKYGKNWNPYYVNGTITGAKQFKYPCKDEGDRGSNCCVGLSTEEYKECQDEHPWLTIGL